MQQKVKNPIVDDTTIFGLDADEKTGREETAEIKQERGKVPGKKDKAPDEAAKKTASESLEAQKISNAESRRAE